MYNKEQDYYIEIETREVLEYKGNINRDGYKTYTNEQKDKKILRHIHEEWNEKFKQNKLSEEGKELYERRKEHIERSFADSKQNHGYRYAMYKGVKKNQNYTWLICSAQNMKNIVLKVSKATKNTSNNQHIFKNIINFIEKIIKLIIFSKLKPLVNF